MTTLKRLAASAALIACSAAALLAGDVTNLYIHLTSGEQIMMRFADKPTINFNPANALIIKSESTSTTIQGFSNVQKITFGSTSGINDANIDSDGQINVDGKTVSLIGFKAGATVNIAGTNGIIYLSQTVEDNCERLDISLDGYPKGVYIISAGETTLKMSIN